MGYGSLTEESFPVESGGENEGNKSLFRLNLIGKEDGVALQTIVMSSAENDSTDMFLNPDLVN
jgi:hypothetical protein